VDYGLDYVRGDGVRLIGYIDSNWAGCAVDRKTTSGCCFEFGSTVISRFSRKQRSVGLSSIAAKYMADWQLVRPAARPFGFASCCLAYLVMS
jgi:hypothetical protein